MTPRSLPGRCAPGIWLHPRDALRDEEISPGTLDRQIATTVAYCRSEYPGWEAGSLNQPISPGRILPAAHTLCILNSPPRLTRLAAIRISVASAHDFGIPF